MCRKSVRTRSGVPAEGKRSRSENGCPSKLTASSSRWVGAKVGVFCSSAPGADPASAGQADFGAFVVGR